jgi:3-oxoacyl-(acyl-carrier-protein) synthase
MKAYINGIGAVSPQNTLSNDHFLDDVTAVENRFLQILKPDYKSFIDPKVLRRMSKIVRMSMVAALTAINEAGVSKPDAIITGTGMGCQADTEKFLNAVLDNDEALLNPTAFIQSTHNTMGAQIALMQANNNYNLTYVNRGFSFESALLDGLMLINEGEVKNLLLGGIDEITDESWLISTKTGMYKANPVNNLKLLENSQEGALSGEGANFFVLTGQKTSNSYACISGLDTFYKPANEQVVLEKIHDFLKKQELELKDIDLVILGYSGNPISDNIYMHLENELFAENATAYFKHLSGEYDTAVSFATWLAAKIIKNGVVPSIVQKRKYTGTAPKKVLIYNHLRNLYHSIILLEQV